MGKSTQQVTTKIILATKRGNWLFLRRSKHDSHPGLWDFPGGGADENEKPLDAALRELKEETGITIKPKKVKRLLKQFSIHADPKLRNRFLYYAEIDTRRPIRLSKEHDKCKWGSPHNMPHPMHPNTLTMLYAIKGKNKRRKAKLNRTHRRHMQRRLKKQELKLAA